MSARAASISTKTGDGGMTGLQGARLSKADPRIEALGTLDELDAVLAEAQSLCTGETGELIETVRDEIFYVIMPALNAPRTARDSAGKVPPVSSFNNNNDGDGENEGTDAPEKTLIPRLEAWIAKLKKANPPTDFVRNWNGPAALKLNLARTVCRRAERRAAAAAAESLVAYLNRLSDLLFLLSAR
ncbi:MAG: ATP:cob(I)alamin adenosyltransferase [Treponema sp.]|jgi:cob(I)alamin adenosyltransferase|nr:ATP:cob(I)alamin adenosyltransferase [Treponema sp.]